MSTTVMFDSPEAAHRDVAIGWFSRRGVFYGDDERMARYDGCTHRACEKCGAPTEKAWLICKPCRDKADLERFNAMPERESNGEMLYSDARDEYYSALNDVDLEEGETYADLRILLCKPQYASIDLDHFSDILPEDGDCDELDDAIEAFNKTMAGVVISWVPIDVRLKL